MKKIPSPSPDLHTLRQHAEQKLRAQPPLAEQTRSEIDTQALVHELQVHQIELEMQNEELHRAQLEAQQAADKYTELFDFAPVGYFVLDAHGLVCEVNLAGAALLGHDRQHVIGQPFEKYVVADSRAQFSAFCRSLRAGEGRRSCEVRLLQHSHRHCDVLVEATMAEDGPGPDPGCRLAVTDITQRKRTEAALLASERRRGAADALAQLNTELERRLLERTATLRESEEQFRAMFDTASIGIAQADPRTGQWLRVNEKMCAITGYSADEMLQMRVLDITHPEDRARDRELFQQVVRAEAPDYRLEKRYVRKDGTLAWVNVNMTVIRDTAGQPTRTVATIENITERKRTEEALRESEERYRQLFESSHDAIMILEPPFWKFTSGNPASAKMFKAQSGEDFISQTPWGLSPDQQPNGRASAEKSKEMIETALRAGSHFFEWTHQRFGGEKFPATVLLSRMQSAGKVFLQATVRDITERKRAEIRTAAFLTLEQRLNAATTMKEAGGIVLRVADELLGWDACFLGLCSAHPQELETVQLYDTIQGQKTEVQNLQRLAFGPLSRQVLRKGGRLLLRPPGEPPPSDLIPFGDTGRRSASLMFVPLRIGPRPLGVLSIQSYTPNAYTKDDLQTLQMLADHCSSAIERTQAEMALREAHEFNQQIIAGAREGIIVHDRDGNHVVWNPFMEELTGRPAAEVLGESPLDVFPFLRHYDFDRMFQRALAGEILNSPDMFYDGGRKGRKVWTAVRFGPLRNGSGAITGVIAMLNDITERKELERQILEISEREQERMGQDLHDGVSQLLTGIVFLNSSLREKLVTRALPEEAADAQRMGELLAQTQMDIRHVARGLQPVAPAPEGLMAALTELTESVSKRCSIACRFQCPRRVLVGDNSAATHLFRIAQEAVHNAVRHGHPKKIVVTLTEEKGTVMLQVQDNGCGLRSAPGPEVGVGLRIMKSRSEAMSGHIEIRPAKPRGTLVRCTVPRPAPARREQS